ncbi:Uncharacterised protein [uncultured archaeon]|nr:Uncharacterised protein [uncultured archaeon]
MTKSEIERELSGKGDYVQIDNITRFLKENLVMDTRRFLYTKLADIYERRRMFIEAADIYGKLSEIALTPTEKLNCYVKETEDYIKSGYFDKADAAIRKIIGEAKISDRNRIMLSVKEVYKNQAQEYEKERRRNHAVKAYEKLLTLDLSDSEKQEINRKLLGLYKELGMIEPFMAMRKKIGE